MVRMRHVGLAGSLAVLALVTHLGCQRSSSEPQLGLELLDAHRRVAWKTEVPVDLNMDGEDEVLLVTDGRRSTADPTQFYHYDILDNLLNGPHTPRGDIQDLKTFDLDCDGKTKEIAVCLEDPYALEIVGHTLDLVARHSLEGCAAADVRLQAAFDGDGSDPLEVLLSVAAKTEPTRTALIAIDWASGRPLWAVDLPGVLQCSVLQLTADAQPRLVAAFASKGSAAFWVLGPSGELLQERELSGTTARVCVLAMADPQRGAQLVTVTLEGASHDATVTSWHALGATVNRQALVQHAALPALTCHHKNSCGIAMGTLRGEVVILDRELRTIASHRVADGAVHVVTTADLDLNGSSDVICCTDGGKAVCLCLPSGSVTSCEARDGVQVVRDGFGVRPLVVTRNGEHYSYFDLTCPAWSSLRGIPATWSRALSVLVPAGAVAGIVGYAAARSRLQRRTRRVLAEGTLPTVITAGDRTLRWANRSMKNLLGDEALAKTRASLEDHLRAAGFTRAGGGRAGPAPELPTSLMKGDRYYSCVAEPLGRDAFGRRCVLIHLSEDSWTSIAAAPDPWAVAAREITAQMRNSLSTIRLTAQWLLLHRQVRGEPPASFRWKLDRVLTEARTLRSLAGTLARAAVVHGDEASVLDPATVIRESLRGLTGKAAGRVGAHVTEPTPAFVGFKRQLVLALETLCEALVRVARERDGVEIASSRESEGRGNAAAVIFEVRLRRGPKPPDGEEPKLPPYATAVADAVAQSHSGFVRVVSLDPAYTAIRMVFPGGAAR